MFLFLRTREPANREPADSGLRTTDRGQRARTW